MITIRKAEITDADVLLTLSKKTFYDFFAHLNEPANMEAYSAVAFTIEKVTSELTNPGSEFYFAVVDDQLAGYLKLNFNDAQTELKNSNTMEVERIYVLAEHHGKRIGGDLLTFAMNTGIERQLDTIWLGVWEHNHSALGFYKNKGFEQFGSHDFMLGNDRQTDLLMKRKL